MSALATTTFEDAVDNELKLVGFLLQGGNPTRAAQACLRLVNLYAAHGQDEEAVAMGRWAMRIDPRAFDSTRLAHAVSTLGGPALLLFREAAQCNLSAGHADAAREVLEVLVEHLPGCPVTRLLLAEARRNDGDIDGSIAALWSAAELFRSAHRYDGQVEVIRRILQTDPKDTAALRELARARLEQGHSDAAVHTLTNLLRLRPADRSARVMLAQALATAGRLPSALGVLRSIVGELSKAGRDYEAHRLIARAFTWCPADEAFCSALDELQTQQVPPVREAAQADRSGPLPLRVVAS